MQALVVVLDVDLPVRFHLGDRPVRDAQVGQAEALERQRLVLLAGERLEQRFRLVGEVDEDEARPRVDGNRPEPEGVAVDLVLADHRRSDQLPVERVGPGVVWALDRASHPARRGLLAQARSPVTADVVEAAQLLVLAPDDDGALPGDVGHEEIARLRSVVRAPHIEPVAEEDPLPGRARRPRGPSSPVRGACAASRSPP